jgi:Xaa-Pro aminopeptidase
MKSGFSILREGITEIELGQYLLRTMFEKGATGIGHYMVGFGKYAVAYAHCLPKKAPLHKGEMIAVDLGATYEGYRSDMYRMACLGKPSKEEAKVVSTIKKANDAVIRKIKEGVKFSDLFKIAEDIFIDEGLKYLYPSASLGHGLGLGLHEWPFITKDNNLALKSRMVLTVEPWTLDLKDWSMGFNVEDVIIVREDGCEVLTKMDGNLYKA